MCNSDFYFTLLSLFMLTPLSNRAENAKVSLKTSEIRVQELESSVKLLQQSKEEYGKALHSEKESVTKIHESHLDKLKSTLNRQKEDHDKELEMLTSEISKLKQERNEATQKIGNLQDEQKNLENSVKTLTSANEELKNALNKANDE